MAADLNRPAEEVGIFKQKLTLQGFLLSSLIRPSINEFGANIRGIYMMTCFVPLCLSTTFCGIIIGKRWRTSLYPLCFKETQLSGATQNRGLKSWEVRHNTSDMSGHSQRLLATHLTMRTIRKSAYLAHT